MQLIGCQVKPDSERVIIVEEPVGEIDGGSLDFSKDINPIIKATCGGQIGCHGPDESIPYVDHEQAFNSNKTTLLDVMFDAPKGSARYMPRGRDWSSDRDRELVRAYLEALE